MAGRFDRLREAAAAPRHERTERHRDA